jgi:hypothetical protein
MFVGNPCLAVTLAYTFRSNKRRTCRQTRSYTIKGVLHSASQVGLRRLQLHDHLKHSLRCPYAARHIQQHVPRVTRTTHVASTTVRAMQELSRSRRGR